MKPSDQKIHDDLVASNRPTVPRKRALKIFPSVCEICNVNEAAIVRPVNGVSHAVCTKCNSNLPT